MKKCLIIPDVHGRESWIDPCKHVNEFEKVIFLGDYLDHYNKECVKKNSDRKISNKSEIENFKSIIQFKKDNQQKCILLLGNHDLAYYSKQYYNTYDYHCRHDDVNHDEISQLFTDNRDLFQFAYIWHNCLFSHAGVVEQLYHDTFDLIIKPKQHLDSVINSYYKQKKHQGLDLYQCSYLRGGFDSYGSIVWADVREHADWCPPQVKMQVFGHTYCTQPLILSKIAMLDTGYHVYTIDENLHIELFKLEDYGKEI